MNKKISIQKLTLMAILSALALVLSFAETQLMPELPFVPVGVKPGLSNIVTTFTASFAGFGGAIYITVLKAAFAFVTRGASAAMMSLSGGVLSTAVLCVMIKHKGKNLSFIGISVLCAAAHNTGQLLCACALSGSALLLLYGKYLLLFAIPSGALTGVILNTLESRLQGVRKRFIQDKPDS